MLLENLVQDTMRRLAPLGAMLTDERKSVGVGTLMLRHYIVDGHDEIHVQQEHQTVGIITDGVGWTEEKPFASLNAEVRATIGKILVKLYRARV